MSDSSKSVVASVPVGGLLGVLFVYLKLTHQIDWSWWWVTLPFWGGIVLVLGIVAVPFILAVLAAGILVLLKLCDWAWTRARGLLTRTT